MPRKKAALVEELEKVEQVQPDVEVVTTVEETENFELNVPVSDGEIKNSKFGKVNCDLLNIRADSSSTSSIIGLLTKGTVVEITGDVVNGFYPIIDTTDPVFKIKGYVKEEFLNL